MNVYRICKSVHTPTSPGYFSVRFETLGLIKAASAPHAIRLAKKMGYFCPIVEPAKERQQ